MDKEKDKTANQQPTKRHRTPKISNAQLAEAIQSNGLNASSIASYIANVFHIKIAISTINGRIAENEQLKKLKAEYLEKMLDASEAKLLNHIKEGNLTALIFFLKTQGKSRGWNERQEITGANGAQLVAASPKFRITFTNNKPKGALDEYE